MIYLITHKSEVADLIKTYVQLVEGEQGKRVQKIRCDNGLEYVNKTVKQWCNQKGIKLDCTTPCTPQLNGKQNVWTHDNEKGKAVLFDLV